MAKMEMVFGSVKFYKSGFGLEVEVSYVDTEGRDEFVRATISDQYGVNFSATGSLDPNGMKAFNRLVAIANALYMG
jgi:hypothetical protein